MDNLSIIGRTWDFQTEIEDIFLSIKNWERQVYYRQEVRGLRMLLEKVNSDLDLWGTWPSENLLWGSSDQLAFLGGVNYGYEFSSLIEKKKKLRHMLVVATRLADAYDQDSDKHYELCRLELQPFLDAGDVRLLLKVSQIYSWFSVADNIVLKRLSNRLRALLHKKSKGIQRDLRILIRRIKKFFLFGLDDESDAVVYNFAGMASSTHALRFNHFTIPINGKR
jgi:hypothetical protein